MDFRPEQRAETEGSSWERALFCAIPRPIGLLFNCVIGIPGFSPSSSRAEYRRQDPLLLKASPITIQNTETKKRGKKIGQQSQILGGIWRERQDDVTWTA